VTNGNSIWWVFLFGLWPRFVVFVLLLLFASLFPLTNTLRNLEDTHAALQLTELLAGVFNDQQPSKILDLLGQRPGSLFFRPTPYGFRQVVQHVSKHVANEIN